ncbi:FAD:protein FMN transferase [Maridesulfovibrio sp.]|uniref:FAD:protein FMN transferase n=1 Tax=Maridesulfovibrio sp. TaxID=2795000 RepID=UPI0029CA1178|nr:FAD:protein FMN transferase [Maridesulfovibrio sp.]
MKWFSGTLTKVTGFFVLLLILALMLVGCGNSSDPVRLQGRAIGTTYSIVAYGLPEKLSPEDLRKGVEQVVAEVNSVMSLFKPDSELSRFNAYRKDDWFSVSKELAGVVQTAKAVNQITGGAFDITVAPLVNLWGFGPDKRPEIIPSEDEIKAAMANVGSDLIEVRFNPPALKKLTPTLTLDLAAIAKGYCVDAVSSWLKVSGISSFMVEIGGEIRTGGEKPGNQPWRIAVEKPVSMERSVQALISLSGKAMATSGDYRNYYEVDGKRYSHIIDPSTGRPIKHTLVSVSVVDETCSRADAFATGLTVLGPERGIALAKECNLSAFFIVKTPDGLSEIATGDFPQHEKMN